MPGKFSQETTIIPKVVSGPNNEELDWAIYLDTDSLRVRIVERPHNEECDKLIDSLGLTFDDFSEFVSDLNLAVRNFKPIVDKINIQIEMNSNERPIRTVEYENVQSHLQGVKDTEQEEDEVIYPLRSE
jgi:hypothetical protein